MSEYELKVATRGNHAALLPVVLIVTSINEARPTPVVTITYEDTALLQDGDKAIVQLTTGSNSVFGTANVIQELTAHFPFLTSKDSKIEAEWISHALIPTSLCARSSSDTLCLPDIALWGALRGNRVAAAALKKGSLVNLTRWYRFLEELCPWTTAAVESMNAVAKEKKVAKSKEGASYDIALKNTENGVVTRFPPEPSGYLHIGHAKAALLNDYFAHEKYNGTMLLRFDDTNPSNEKQEFEDAIVEDLALMGIKPNKMTYTSDYFDELYDYCIKIIKQGDAYADDTDKETMAAQRWDGLPSQRRDLSSEESLSRLEEMKSGTPEGLRWPCVTPSSTAVTQRSTRTGSKWKIYPTYDFACPIVDSMEGVTHALRTIEYRDRNPQYQWMLDTMKLRNVQVWDFARMNFVRTLLSKRKLTKLVETGLVWGWDDPRFPTIRGIRRRGMTIPALREFILKQGPSKAVTNFDWGLIWATNKKYIDPIAPRHTTIYNKNVVKTTVTGGPATPYSEEKPRHIKNAAVGMKKVVYSSSIILEQEDVKLFKPDEEITLMNWGNAIVRKVSTNAEGIITDLELELHMAGDVKKTEKKVTWLATEGQDLVPVELVDFDHLLTKDSLGEDDVLEDFLNLHTEFREEGLADCNVADLKGERHHPVRPQGLLPR
ncbi:Glutamyl/glutaminyl-tRNA synthetase class Ib [Penicillium expansum]|nr:Glutamyl/glutaminyl-tRNA synthetase class Ib [Penicillium expansum]